MHTDATLCVRYSDRFAWILLSKQWNQQPIRNIKFGRLVYVFRLVTQIQIQFLTENKFKIPVRYTLYLKIILF